MNRINDPSCLMDLRQAIKTLKSEIRGMDLRLLVLPPAKSLSFRSSISGSTV